MYTYIYTTHIIGIIDPDSRYVSRACSRPIANRPCCRKGGRYGWIPHRAQIVRFELFKLIRLFQFDTQFPAEQFEATVSQSTEPFPPSLTHAPADPLPLCPDTWIQQTPLPRTRRQNNVCNRLKFLCVRCTLMSAHVFICVWLM